MQNIDEVLLHKHCKEGAYVATQFFTQLLIKFLKKKPKIVKTNNKKPKNIFLMYLRRL